MGIRNNGAKAMRLASPKCYAARDGVVLMTRLDPDDLRRYAQRDWSAPERLARRERAQLAVAERVRLAIALYEGAKATDPTWPNEAMRRADFEAHVRLKQCLDAAADVGTR